MKDLIAKLEAAKEGSPELDAEVLNIIYGPTKFGPRRPDGIPEPHGDGHWAWDGDAMWAPVSRSLDAALTLVPEGMSQNNWPGPMSWSVVYEREASSPLRRYFADVREYRSSFPKAFNAWAPTPALALCVAALKARTP